MDEQDGQDIFHCFISSGLFCLSIFMFLTPDTGESGRCLLLEAGDELALNRSVAAWLHRWRETG
jgi:hypothetical protein